MEEKRDKNTWKSVALDEIKNYIELFERMQYVDGNVSAEKVAGILNRLYSSVNKIREKGDGIQGCAACKHLIIENPAPDVTLYGCDKGVKALTTSFNEECRFCENRLRDVKKALDKQKEVIEKITNPKTTKEDLLHLIDFKVRYYLDKGEYDVFPTKQLAEELLSFQEIVKKLPDYPHPYDATLATLNSMPISIINHDEVDELLDAIDKIKKYMQEDWVKEKLKGGEA